MKRTVMLLILAGAAFLFLGCMEMLTFNLFAAADAPKTPAADELKAMGDEELVDAISELVGSDSFYADLAADETGEMKGTVIGGLTKIFETYEDLPEEEQTPEAQQQALDASVLVAEVELNSTEAGQVIDNFVTVATTFIDDPPDFSTPEGITDLAESVMTEVFADVTDSESFNEAITALLEAADAFTFYGENLDTDPDTEELEIPEGTDVGSVAQDAIVALLVAEVLTAPEPTPENPNPEPPLTVEELEAVVIGGEEFPDEFAMSGNPLEDNEALGNVLEASGLAALFEGGMF